jgi:hypothetical protein
VGIAHPVEYLQFAFDPKRVFLAADFCQHAEEALPGGSAADDGGKRQIAI